MVPGPCCRLQEGKLDRGRPQETNKASEMRWSMGKSRCAEGSAKQSPGNVMGIWRSRWHLSRSSETAEVVRGEVRVN